MPREREGRARVRPVANAGITGKVGTLCQPRISVSLNFTPGAGRDTIRPRFSLRSATTPLEETCHRLANCAHSRLPANG